MKIDAAKELETVATLRQAVSEHVAMQALCMTFRNLAGERWGLSAASADDEQTADPDAEVLAILRALPQPGMPVETLMAAYAWTTDDTPQIAAERKRLAGLVVKMLTEAT